MNITWHGINCFTIKGKDVTLVIDPYNKTGEIDLPKLSANIIAVTNNEKYHNIKNFAENPFIVDSQGEYEVKGACMKTIKNGETFSYSLDIDDIKICHLGDMNNIPSDEIIEELGTVDILMIPVGGNEVFDAKKAHEMIEQIDPKVVIPMHYKIDKLDELSAPLDVFLKEIGNKEITPIDVYKIQKSLLPTQTTDFIVLTPSLS